MDNCFYGIVTWWCVSINFITKNVLAFTKRPRTSSIILGDAILWRCSFLSFFQPSRSIWNHLLLCYTEVHVVVKICLKDFREFLHFFTDRVERLLEVDERGQLIIAGGLQDATLNDVDCRQFTGKLTSIDDKYFLINIFLIFFSSFFVGNLSENLHLR
jgi:hypothetical protein